MDKQEFANNFYKNEIIKLNDYGLYRFLDEQVGVSETGYFNAKFSGNLQVQQIPLEYVGLLNFFRSNNIKKYLELGVGNGGSFFINSIFLQKSVEIVHCVDSLEYTNFGQTFDKINKKIEKLKEFFPNKNINFFNMNTDVFFENNKEEYDCIFIDADHSYSGVIKDYYNSLKFIKKGGWLIFHDIQSTDTGVFEAWEELKNKQKIMHTFLHPYIKTCGIGIMQVNF